MDAPLNDCSVPVAAYIVVSIFVISLRLFASAQHTIAWIQRSRKALKRNAAAREHKGRLPIVPILSWLLTLIYFLMFLLSGLNIINVQNGGSPLMFGMGWTLFGIVSLLYLTRFVSLGYKIALPSSRLGLLNGAERLSRFDTKGKISLVLSILAIVVQFCFLCIVPFYYKTDDRFIRAAIGVEGYFLIQHAISITNHIERVKSMIRKSRDAIADNASDTARKELDRVLKSLTHQEVVLDVASLISVTFHFLIAFDVLPLYWIVGYCFLILESVNTSLIALADTCGKRQGKHPKKEGLDEVTDSRGSSAEMRSKHMLSNLASNAESQVAPASSKIQGQ